MIKRVVHFQDEILNRQNFCTDLILYILVSNSILAPPPKKKFSEIVLDFDRWSRTAWAQASRPYDKSCRFEICILDFQEKIGWNWAVQFLWVPIDINNFYCKVRVHGATQVSHWRPPNTVKDGKNWIWGKGYLSSFAAWGTLGGETQVT